VRSNNQLSARGPLHCDYPAWGERTNPTTKQTSADKMLGLKWMDSDRDEREQGTGAPSGLGPHYRRLPPLPWRQSQALFDSISNLDLGFEAEADSPNRLNHQACATF